MKVKTSELIGPPLDWATGEALFRETGKRRAYKPGISWMDVIDQSAWQPSSNWAQGGPIIHRESIALEPDEGMEAWRAVFQFRQGVDWVEGPTPLVAAMRCYVASKLGDEVDIPEELL